MESCHLSLAYLLQRFADYITTILNHILQRGCLLCSIWEVVLAVHSCAYYIWKTLICFIYMQFN